MKIKQLGSNMTLLTIDDGSEYFFSYETCVAGFTPGDGYWRTSKKWSQTTSRHINKYLDGVTATMVDQDDIELSLSTF